MPPLLDADVTRCRRSAFLHRFESYVHDTTYHPDTGALQYRYLFGGTAHGSFVSGLSGALSDMDIILELHPSVGKLSKAKKVEILNTFKKRALTKKNSPMAAKGQIQEIRGRVPVLKFQDAETKCEPVPES